MAPELESRPKSSKKTKIELVILLILLGVAIGFGVPAYKNYQNLEKAIALFEAGDACLHKSDIAGAKAKFEEAISVCPHLRGAYEELAALAYFDDHDVDKACEYYEKAIAVMPDCPDIYISYAQFMFTTMNYEKARDLAQKAVDLVPSDKMYQNNLDLFTKMCTDPQMVENHKKARQGMGVEMPGAHHHVHHASDEHHAVEQPAAEQPAAEQPAAEQPAAEQAAAEQAAAEQPAAEQPVAEQPVAEQPSAEAQSAQ